MPVTGKSRVAGILGWPVAHSLSPVMHNAAFGELGLDWVYVPFPVAPQRLGEAVAGLKALGVAGFNVTIPHKIAVMPLLDRLSPEAELIGAVNTVAVGEDGLTGYNTDGVGLIRALEVKLGVSVTGASVLVLGAGGAARSAVVALSRAGAARVEIVNRSPEKGEELVRLLDGRLPGTALAAYPLERLAQLGYLASFDLVVNTTSVGMKGESFGMDLSGLAGRLAVYDMVYAPAVTPLLEQAGRCGIACANGLGMLVAQGEAAFEIWTGMTPPAGCMERALGQLAAAPR